MEPSRVTLEEAQELFQICMPGIKKEEKPAADCLGQILAEPVYAAVTQPPFPRSAMDGFALRSRDVCGADLEHPVTLEVAGCVYAGQKTELILEPHQAVRIMTGAMIPEGADCVVKQEDTDYVIFIFGKLYQIYLTSSICLCLLFFRFSLSFLCFFYMEFTFLIFFEFWCRGASLFVERFYQK